MDYIAFGRRVRHLRRERRLTQEQLAELAGVSASFMGHIERGTRIASLETLVRLCHALDATPDQLLAFPAKEGASLIPAGMPGEMQARLAELLYQGYLVLQAGARQGG